jgi:Cu/Ag efflux protein CusF
MFLRVSRFAVSAAFALHVLGKLAFAQDADIRLQGAIETIDAQSVAIKVPDGAIATLKLTPDTSVFVNQPSSLDQIKPGDYVASTTVKAEDGKMRSKELRIFPEALRGLGDGARPMDAPNTTMINAGVSEVVAAPQGQLLKVKYQDGTAEFVVDAQTAVSAIVPSDLSVLKAGSRVFLLATKNAGGELVARRIIGMR